MREEKKNHNTGATKYTKMASWNMNVEYVSTVGLPICLSPAFNTRVSASHPIQNAETKIRRKKEKTINDEVK